MAWERDDHFQGIPFLAILCLLYGSMEGVWFVPKVREGVVCIAYVNLKPT